MATATTGITCVCHRAPARGQPDCTCRSFPVDPAALATAVRALAPALHLTQGDDERWHIDVPLPHHRGAIVVARDGLTAQICVRIVPSVVAPPATLAEVTTATLLIAAPVYLLLLFMILVGLTSGRILFLAIVVIANLCPILVLLGEARSAWRHYQARRWTRDWHARFWPALSAHLARQPPYR